MSESDLRRQLVAAIKSRAMVYAAVYEELAAELGEARAEGILKRAIHRRGLEVGRQFARFAPDDFAGLRDAFIDFVPDHGATFRPEVTRCDASGLDIKFHACPLKEAWIEAGFDEPKLATLCRIAGVVDSGTFEAAGFRLEPDTWRPGRDGCCFLHIRAKQPRG